MELATETVPLPAIVLMDVMDVILALVAVPYPTMSVKRRFNVSWPCPGPGVLVPVEASSNGVICTLAKTAVTEQLFSIK
jgi:hypothetical protein